MKALCLTLLLGLLMPAAWAMTSDAPYPLASESGVIESLDFAGGTMVVDGVRYALTSDVEVSIGGSYGAFTMLRTGMQIRYDYLVVSANERRMVLIEEVPGNVRVEQT